LKAALASKRALLVPPGYVLRADLNEFLYAPVYEERHGMTLSVLSAMARLGLDPWEQATTLATHTREAAARELALLMSALPEWAAPGHDEKGITARLVALLPAAAGRQCSAAAAVTPPEPADHTSNIMWIYAIIMLLLMSAQWLSTRSHRDPPDSIPQIAPQGVAQSAPSDSQHQQEIAE
jgi:hypothetical protein